MKKKALRKDFYMEIRRTLNRFLSIFLITALGVAFFSGVRAAKPDMRLSADAFYDESNLMDIRVMSTLGMTKEDLEAIQAVEGVKEVMPSYSVDVFCELPEERLNIQVMSLPDKMNRICVMQGRLPKTDQECLVDHNLTTSGKCRIGDTLVLKSGTEDPLSDALREEAFTVVGSGTTSYYMSLDRGTTSIGSGSLDGFLVVPASAFSMDYYTQICVTAEGAFELTCYTQEYDSLVDELAERLEGMEKERCEIRYADIQEEGQEKIAEAEAEVADGEQKLLDAGEELADARAKLEDARIKLADGQQELADGERELAEHERDLADARQKVADGWKDLNHGKNKLDLEAIKVQNGRTEYQQKKAELDAGYAQLAQSDGEKAKLEEQLAQVEAGIAAVEQTIQNLPESTPEAERQQWEAQLAGLKENKEKIKAGLAQISQAKAELDAGAGALAQAKAQLDKGSDEIEAGYRKLLDAEQELRDAEAEIADGEIKLADGQTELADARVKLADAEAEFAEAEEKLLDGEREYEKARLESEETIADAKIKIEDAKKELADLDFPEWYVLDRQYIQTYVEYGNDADRIGAIGEVFPAIFFLVAALVSLTTMTRMVEEQRTQIGTMKALGYGKGAIASKYIFYALFSSLLGSLFGLAAGQKFLPAVIISAYQILYNNLPTTLTPFNLWYSVTASAAAVACTTLAAWAACWKELNAVPAELMRPAAPKAGKRVFLEVLPFLWRRLNFSMKATVRNLVRYKKRFFMTVFGIASCMALLLVGFGLKDSILYIGSGQFGNVFVYDGSIGLDKDADEEEKEAFWEAVQEDERIAVCMEARENAVDVEAGGSPRSAYLVVPKTPEDMADFICLRDRESREAYTLDEDGVIVTEKLAKLLGVSKGDTIVLKEDDTKQVEAVISHITENYFMHYVYMSGGLYEKLYGKTPEWNQIFLKNVQNDEAFEDQMQADYMEMEAVSDVTFVSGTAQRVADMLKSMDLIIYVLVAAAGLLAFVVLYNLNNINISERKRELATLKVLGFFDGEVSSYVNRENILLTLIGTGAGVFLGMALHRFIIVTAEVDMLMFGRMIAGKSYLYSILITFAFSAVVNGVMFFKLRGIDMIESLKSVE